MGPKGLCLHRDVPSEGPGYFPHPHDALPSLARAADPGIANRYFKGGGHGVHEVELADGADILAEGSSLEETIHGKGRGEVGQGEPRRDPGAGP